MSSLYNSSDDAAFLGSTHRHKAASHSHLHPKPHVDSQQPQLSESPRSRGSVWGRAETVYVWERVCVCVLHTQSRHRVHRDEWRRVRNRARTSDYSPSGLSHLDKKKLWRSSGSQNRQVHTTYNNSWLVLQNMAGDFGAEIQNNAAHCVTTNPRRVLSYCRKWNDNEPNMQPVCWLVQSLTPSKTCSNIVCFSCSGFKLELSGCRNVGVNTTKVWPTFSGSCAPGESDLSGKPANTLFDSFCFFNAVDPVQGLNPVTRRRLAGTTAESFKAQNKQTKYPEHLRLNIQNREANKFILLGENEEFFSQKLRRKVRIRRKHLKSWAASSSTFMWIYRRDRYSSQFAACDVFADVVDFSIDFAFCAGARFLSRGCELIWSYSCRHVSPVSLFL